VPSSYHEKRHLHYYTVMIGKIFPYIQDNTKFSIQGYPTILLHGVTILIFIAVKTHMSF